MKTPRLPRVFARSRVKAIAIVAGLGVIQAACLFGATIATRQLFMVLSGQSTDTTWMYILICVSAVGGAAARALARIEAEALGHSFAIDLRETVFRAIGDMPAQRRVKRTLGGLSLRFVGDMTAARSWAGLGLTSAITSFIVFPAAAYCLWWLDPMLALLGLGLVALAVFGALVLGAVLRQRHAMLRKRRANMAIFAMERIAAAERLLHIGRFNREVKALRRNGKEVSDRAVERISRVSLLRALPETALGFGAAIILWFAVTASLPASTTAAALSILAIVALPLSQLVGVWDRYAAWSVARERCRVLLASVEDQEPETEEVGKLPWAGEIAGFAGTYLDTCSAFLRRAFTEALDSKQTSALISDDPVILRGSLRRVLTLGSKKRPDDKTILDLANANGLGPLVEKIGGLGGRIQENGANLSRSEGLRISVVQAVLSKPEAIVIDSVVWSHLSDARWLFLRLAADHSTILHGLPEPIARETARWITPPCAIGETSLSNGNKDEDFNRCA